MCLNLPRYHELPQQCPEEVHGSALEVYRSAHKCLLIRQTFENQPSYVICTMSSKENSVTLSYKI